MRWWNNNRRSVDEGGNGESPQTNNLHKITSDAKEEHELSCASTTAMLVKGEDEGQRQFSLFRRRRRRTDYDVNQDIIDQSGLLSKSEQDNNTDANTTTVAASMSTAAGRLACQKEGGSLLSGSPGALHREIDVQSVESTNKSSGDIPTKFNWFGLRRNNQTISPRQEYEKSCEYASINEQNKVIADETQSSVDDNYSEIATEVDESSGEQLDKTDGARCINNWFAFLKPTRNEDSIEIHRLLETDQMSTDNDANDDGENFEEESCPEADRIPSSSCDSMDSGDIVLEISDDERLQALFDQKFSAQQSEQEDESENLECEDYEGYDVNKVDKDPESASLINVSRDDDIFQLWKRRQRLKRKLHIEAPILNRRDDAASASINMLGSVQLEAGGGRNEENLRSLELESHLIDSSSNNNGADKQLARMKVMHAKEKEREDLLYEQWLLDMAIIDGQEPEYGYDNRGWYSTLTQREDGADDLEYINSSAMNVSTEDSKRCDDESNRWLDTAGNIALLIFAPDLYFIKQSELNTEYHVTPIKEEGEDAGIEQKDGWFKNLFTKWTGNEE